MDFDSKRFFDLTHFPYADVFKPEEPIWTTLKNIKGFLADFFAKNGTQIRGNVSEGAIIEGDVFIEEGAIVEPTAYIKGPTIIGARSEVRHGAYVRGNVIVGPDCVVGHATEVKGSIFLNGAKAGHFAYVGDSILGNEVNLGAGTKLANLKVSPGNVILRIDGKKTDSGLRKFGAILGDRFQSGCNSVTNPGFIVASHSIVYPNVSAKGVHQEKSIIK